MKMNAHFLYLHGTNIQFTLDWKKKKDLYISVCDRSVKLQLLQNKKQADTFFLYTFFSNLILLST